MSLSASKLPLLAGFLVLALALPDTAAALRCGNKIVKDGMHEVEVVAICGEPTARRHLGFAIRGAYAGEQQVGVPGWTVMRSPGYYYPAEVMVTEFIYNLGPRKLMRRLVFEGGLLVRVETLGRGYHE